MESWRVWQNFGCELRNLILMNAIELYRKGRKVIEAAGCGDGEIDARALLLHSLNISPEYYYAHADEMEITPPQAEDYENMLRKRIARVPVAYITKSREFMGLDFAVNPSTLIPRPATETLVEKGIEILEKHTGEAPLAADIGTGSGNIALSLAYFNDKVNVYASDISPHALKTAGENVNRLNREFPGKKIRERIHLLEGNLFELFPPELKGRFDLVLSNPPYVTNEEWESLMDGVRLYEPRMALCPPGEPEDLYGELLKQAREFLAPEGWMAVEIGAAQGDMLKDLFRETGYDEIFLLKDLEGFDRVAGGQMIYR